MSFGKKLAMNAKANTEAALLHRPGCARSVRICAPSPKESSSFWILDEKLVIPSFAGSRTTLLSSADELCRVAWSLLESVVPAMGPYRRKP
jgi:hypothetical protein